MKETQWKVEREFHLQDLGDELHESSTKIESLHRTLKRALEPLRTTMLNQSGNGGEGNRRFRGEFVKVIREYRELSQKQLSRLINSHMAFEEIAECHHAFWSEFPFTPEFLERFEEKTESILEEFTQGMLFGVGFSTEKFALLVAKICKAEDSFTEFRNWYSQVEVARLQSNGVERKSLLPKGSVLSVDFRSREVVKLVEAELTKLGVNIENT